MMKFKITLKGFVWATIALATPAFNAGCGSDHQVRIFIRGEATPRTIADNDRMASALGLPTSLAMFPAH